MLKMLKNITLALLGLCCLQTAFAQQEQPVEPYPFRITLTNTDSTEIASSKVLTTGKPTVLAFWLTTCMPCMAEFKAYTQQYEQWKKEADFQLIGISLDFPQRFRQIATVAAAQKWPFPVYWDSTRAFKSLMPGGLNGVPQVFLFDKKGALVWQHKGFYPGMEGELFARVKELR